MYPALLADLAKDMLAMADRGFFSYQAWKDSAATGAALFGRMKASSVLPVAEELGESSYRSAVYPSGKDRAKDSNGIPVRVIEYEVTTGEEASTFLLITSILDPAAAPAGDLAGLYARRWDIGSSFAELKTHQRGPDVVLRSKTPDGGAAGKLRLPVCALRDPLPRRHRRRGFRRRPPRGFPSHAPAGQRGGPSPGARLFPLSAWLKPSQSSAGKSSTNSCHPAGNAPSPARRQTQNVQLAT